MRAFVLTLLFAATVAATPLALPPIPKVPLHTEFVVEVNAKGQVVRVKSAKASKDAFFNTQTNGNVLQMWIRHPDGSAQVGLYRVTYDFDPHTKKVSRQSAIVSQSGGNWGNEPGAATVMIDTARREYQEAQEKQKQQNGTSAAARGYRWRDAVAHAPPLTRRFRASSCSIRWRIARAVAPAKTPIRAKNMRAPHFDARRSALYLPLPILRPVAPYKQAQLALAGVAINCAFFAIILFGPAWTFDWWRAWVILAIVAIGTAGSTLDIARANTGLIEERFKSPVQQGQPLGDKIMLLALLTSFLGYLLLTSLDASRLHLLPPPPAWLCDVGLLAVIAGWGIAWRALRENAFAAPVVKLQDDRSQRVIDTGLYGYVRHPLYAGGALLIVGIPLWLQSTAGAIASCVPIFVLIARILLEERFLRRELPGYDAYAARVRYRLIPLIW